MSHAYAITNALTGLAATAFTWSSGYTTGRSRLNDGLQDELAAGSSSAQASGQTLDVNMGVATALVGFALLNHNLGTGACAVKVEGADNAAFTVNLVTAKAASTVTTSEPNDRDLVLQFPSVTKQYWRLTFTHTGTKTIQLGEVMALASVTTLSRMSIYGAGERERFVTNRVETDTGGIRSTVLAGPIRTKSFSFVDMQGTSQRDELMTMWRGTRGGSKNLLWLETVESQATAASAAGMECLWGKLSESHGWTNNDFNLYGVDGFELVGLGREAGS